MLHNTSLPVHQVLLYALPEVLQYYRVIHTIQCHDPKPMNHHGSLITEDVPGRINEEGLPSIHLFGVNPICDLESYFRDNPGIAFVVIREHRCAKTFASASSKNHQSNALPESISIVSQGLLKALAQVATCQLDEVNYRDTFPQPEMAAPYFFLYHHRSELLQLAEELQPVHCNRHGTSEEITALLNYINKAKGDEFREADELLKKGKTNRRHYQKLFCPNDIVIVQNKNCLSAFVPHQWPTRTDEGLKIACWSWHLQGKWLRRKQEDLDLSRLTSEEVSIQDLKVHPLRYASSDVRDRLRLRGQKYWNMRHRTFVSYSGDDFLDEQHHVSIPTLMPFLQPEIYV